MLKMCYLYSVNGVRATNQEFFCYYTVSKQTYGISCIWDRSINIIMKLQFPYLQKSTKFLVHNFTNPLSVTGIIGDHPIFSVH